MTDPLDRLSAALADRYTIERELGRGGMATVYLAEDLKHKRKVALKVLKPELAAVLGAERFVQEITTTAALQHPHILPLFDSGEADGFLYYVMPFIDGETLRDTLNRETQLGIDQAVRIAREVADALDYAHRNGVVHRDIKPENILIAEGRPMVADFGIALALSAAAGGRMTETGLSLGTPHYMSPEQATAEKEISARSDVYSLGSVLYEMLAGEPPHIGGSAQQIIMKIIAEQAQPLTALRKSVPANVAAAVAKSLEKLPADRFESAKVFAEALGNPGFTTTAATGGTAGVSSTAIPRRMAGVLGAAAALLVAIALWGWLRPVPEVVLHVSVPPPVGTSFLGDPRWPALSPDGETVVFAATRDGVSRLYRRAVNGFEVEAIEGSEDATFPFFSPDGQWVAFYTVGRKLRKVPLAGGAATPITDIPFWRSGATWRRDGTIVVVGDSRGLFVVPDHGGTLVPLAPRDTLAADMLLSDPRELADGRLLATRRTGKTWADGENDFVMMVPGDTAWQLVSGGASGAYVSPGFLLTRPGNELVARRFNLDDGTLSGSAAPVLPGLASSLDLSGAIVNARGDVAYFAFGEAPPTFLVTVDRAGRATRIPVDAANYRHPRLSHDGVRAAFSLGITGDLWVLDLRTNTWQRLTTNESITEPQWSPDDRRLIHTIEDTVSGYNLPAWRNSGGGDAILIQRFLGDAWVSDWSPDGRYLAVYGGDVGMNVSVLDLEQPDSLRPVTRVAESTTRNARFSPDGRWLAYQSNETGRMQVYIIEWATLGQKKAISTEGGTEPAWNPRGGELFYRNGPSMMAVSITTSPTLTVGSQRELFRRAYQEDLYGDRSFDVMPDGQQFLMFEANPDAAPELRVIRNWAVELDSLTKGP